MGRVFDSPWDVLEKEGFFSPRVAATLIALSLNDDDYQISCVGATSPLGTGF